MCSHSSPVGEEEEKQRKRSSTRDKNKKKTTRESISKIPSNLGPSRKIRTKTRRPKFLSLRLELNSSSHDSPSNHKTKIKNNNKTKTKNQSKKPREQNKKIIRKTTPFQLQPETLTEKEGYVYQYDAVAVYLFNSGTDDSAAVSSIHDLLDSSSAATAAGNPTVSGCGGGQVLSPYDRQDHGSSTSSSQLVRTAMRRGASEEAAAAEEERWVSYSEVVVEEVMSRSGTPRWYGDDVGAVAEDSGNVVGRPSLALKLDYQQIMEAWSDKGPLYVDGEPPQTVPDLYAGGGCTNGVGSVWVVPDMEEAEKEKRGRREASLLRYKEKRQSRLFAKRIRYEVRKLNAEKRPRIKGRFVKRVDS